VSKKLSEDEIARRLWAEAVQFKGGRLGLIRITGAAPNQVQERIFGLTVDEARRQLNHWTEERQADFARQVEALFRQISAASFLGPAVAADLFRAVLRKRRRSTSYSSELNRALGIQALVFGAAEAARHAIALGLDVDEAALVRRIGRLQKKAGVPPRTKVRKPRTDK
jgi:hypothetical protein